MMTVNERSLFAEVAMSVSDTPTTAHGMIINETCHEWLTSLTPADRVELEIAISAFDAGRARDGKNDEPETALE